MRSVAGIQSRWTVLRLGIQMTKLTIDLQACAAYYDTDGSDVLVDTFDTHIQTTELQDVLSDVRGIEMYAVEEIVVNDPYGETYTFNLKDKNA